MNGKILDPDLYAVAREAANSSDLSPKIQRFHRTWRVLLRAVCGNHLFRSDAKFSSTCGWPSFFEADKQGVVYKRDNSHGMERIEVYASVANLTWVMFLTTDHRQQASAFA